MFKEDTLFELTTNWFKYKPEDELYYKLEANPFYPFRQIGYGYYYVVVQSDRAAYGKWFLLATIIAYIAINYAIGIYSLPQSFFLICFFFCFWTLYGRVTWRELIISRRGRGSYMLRVLDNQEKLHQHELRNIYIRLTKKDDASGDPYFWLNLSGYELDDYRITRMTKAENALRIMGMKMAYTLGVNYFDWKDESEEHLIFHYKTFTKLRFQTQMELIYKRRAVKLQKPVEEVKPTPMFLSVPSRKIQRVSSDDEATPPKQRKVSMSAEDDVTKRKPRFYILNEDNN